MPRQVAREVLHDWLHHRRWLRQATQRSEVTVHGAVHFSSGGEGVVSLNPFMRAVAQEKAEIFGDIFQAEA